MQTQIGIRPRWRGFKSWLSHMPVCDSDKSFWTSVSSPVKPGLWHPYLMGYCGDTWVNLCKELTTVPKMTCVSLLPLLFPIIIVSLLFLFFKRKHQSNQKEKLVIICHGHHGCPPAFLSLSLLWGSGVWHESSMGYDSILWPKPVIRTPSSHKLVWGCLN